MNVYREETERQCRKRQSTCWTGNIKSFRNKKYIQTEQTEEELGFVDLNLSGQNSDGSKTE